jgi:hypothetical protein
MEADNTEHMAAPSHADLVQRQNRPDWGGADDAADETRSHDETASRTENLSHDETGLSLPDGFEMPDSLADDDVASDFVKDMAAQGVPAETLSAITDWYAGYEEQQAASRAWPS